MRYKIKEVKDKFPKGYIGMNDRAYKTLYHKKYPYSSKTVCVFGGLGKKARKHTLKHEMIENQLMRNKNMHYRTAHKYALKYEQNTRPINKIIRTIK